MNLDVIEEDDLIFNRFFPQRVRHMTFDFDEFQEPGDLELLKNPHITRVCIKGTPPVGCRLQEFFPKVKMVDFECDNISAENQVVPPNVVLTFETVLKCCGLKSLWTDFREIRIVPYPMTMMVCVTCASMENVRALTVILRDAEDILSLLTGYAHVKVLTIIDQLEYVIRNAASVEKMASMIPTSWKRLTLVRVCHAIGDRSFFAALQKGLKPSGIQVIQSVY